MYMILYVPLTQLLHIFFINVFFQMTQTYYVF